MAEPGRPSAYTRSDALLLAALMIGGGGPDGRPVTLSGLLSTVDALNHSIPTFDEVSFGIPRLVAGGFAAVLPGEAGDLALRPSTAANELLQFSRRSRDFASDVAVALGTLPYPEPEAEDRSPGRLADLDRAAFDRELQVNQSWQQKVSPRGWALVESTLAEQVAAHGEPVSNWKPRRKRSSGAQGREAQ